MTKSSAQALVDISVMVKDVLLPALGETAAREGLLDTPRRFASMMLEMTSGLRDPPPDVTTFERGNCDQMVTVLDIDYHSLCEHHLVPFHGRAHVGYIPKDRLMGLSKFGRIVDWFARRPQIQERMTAQVADFLVKTLEPQGLIVVVEGSHLCYDRLTEVLTPEGWVRFDVLERGIEVAQVDHETLEMSFVEPTDYLQYHYRGEMLGFGSQSISLLVTPDHRMVYAAEWEHEKGEGRWSVLSAAELPGRFYLPTAVRWSVPDQETIPFAGHEVDGDDLVRFLAAWLSEGCTSEYRRSGTHGMSKTTRISQDVGPFEAEIGELLARLPWKFGRYAQGEGRPGHVQFCSNDRALFEALRPFGKSGEKFVPAFVKEMSARQIEIFLDWYAKGDGHRYKHNDLRVQYVSKSRRMIDDLQELLVRIGRTGAVQWYGDHGRIETRTHKRGAKGYKGYAKIRPENRYTLEFDDDVFCVSVPTGALLVRREGRTAVSGNCMSMRGVKKANHLTVTSAIRGSIPRAEFFDILKCARHG